MQNKRIVITGLGMISPVGSEVEKAWQAILNGKSGIRKIDEFDITGYPCRIAGLVNDFNVNQYLTHKDIKKCDVFMQYGIAAGIQAIKDAGLDIAENFDPKRVGILIGSGIGGLQIIEKTQVQLKEKGPKKISPFFIPSVIINLIAGHLAIKYGFQGPNLAITTACTTGTHSIGLAARLIAYGDADVMLAGGAEKASSPSGMAGFAAAKALTTNNENPKEASCPWDIRRDGFILGDGSACVVLECYEHAKARGANIYAELVGFGMSDDAFHITRPPEGATGACDAMLQALKDAKISAEQIDYINAHATSTSAGDVDESLAIQAVLGQQSSENISVSSTKSMTGHLLGAAGAIEAVFTILAIRDQVAPPTINLNNLDPKAAKLDYVPNVARQRKIQYAMSNSFGFGGTNGCLLFKKYSL